MDFSWLLAIFALLTVTFAHQQQPNLEIGSSVAFRSLDGVSFPTTSGELVFCTRIQIPGHSRIFKPHKFAHSLKINVEQNEAVYYPRVDACLHRNSSLEPCHCPKENWKPVQQGSWTAFRSPYENWYLDIRAIDSYTDTAFKVTATEEFRYYHLAFLFSGLATLLLSGLLSSWVPFYYSSGMSLGILLIVLIILYQGMKLLPGGKKSTLSILLYGSLLGFGTVLLQYVASLCSSAVAKMGFGEDTINSVTVLVPIILLISGAWLGYWSVRKLILAEDGSVDVGTAQFVKWALRLVGATLLLQSSHDDLFALLLLAIGGLVCWASENIKLGSFKFWNPINSVRSLFASKKTSANQRRRNHSEFFYKVWSQTQTCTVQNPQPSSSETVYSSSPKTPDTRRNINKDQDFYSSFHNTLGKKQLTTEEYAEVSKSFTEDAIKDLVTSPDFARWAVNQADRIIVAPFEPREERPEHEIEKTAVMEPLEDLKLTPGSIKPRF